ncbi:hypothetical protein D3C72_2376450 [compost metagenome]
MASTDAHKTLAANVESSNRDLETAHSQLLDELMGKIDLISNADIRVPSVGEPTSGPSLESITEATLARENSSPADVRTA